MTWLQSTHTAAEAHLAFNHCVLVPVTLFYQLLPYRVQFCQHTSLQ